nr:hypothetical protein [uncultured Flavobacterium sp.]
MSRASSKTKEREFQEWERGLIANIGTTSTIPYDILFHHIEKKKLHEIINLFFDNNTKIIDQLDQCILEQFWWIDTEIVSARYSKIKHPNYYSGEYIFDRKNGERTVLEVRQPDIDGKHWKAEHIHIKRGQIDPQNIYGIIKPTFNEHIELASGKINGFYIMKIF